MAGGTHYTQLGKKTEFFSIIYVTYPPGSLCTCSDGTYMLSATDTSGKYIFLLPKEGTWNFFLNGNNTGASVTASIRGKREVCFLL